MAEKSRIGHDLMRRYELRSPHGPDGWKMVKAETPVPGPQQILVRVRATSLNYRDLGISLTPKQKTPVVPLSDGAGEVAAVGEGVTSVKVGDRVAGTFFQNWPDGPTFAEIHSAALGGPINGVLAEYAVLEESGVVPIPDTFSFEEAATLPCAAVTAWNALFETAGLKPGETVLLLGTGGVSIFALQFAKAAGARVILTSSSDEKLHRAREMGADEVINYRIFPEWDRMVWDITAKRGVDHVIEVGGAGTLERSLRSVRYGGTVSLIGVLTGFDSRIDPYPIMFRSVRMNGIYVGSRAMFLRMNAALKQNGVRPVIDRVFEFDEAPEALSYLQSGSHFGKIVVRVA